MGRLFNHQDRLGGALLVALGLFVALYAQRWSFGSMARLGPGFFPISLGLILAAIGAAIVATRWRAEATIPPANLKAGAFILVSLVAFALTLRPLGLVAASLLTATLASMADNDTGWGQRLVLVVCVTAITVGIFKFGLGMTVPLFWFG